MKLHTAEVYLAIDNICRRKRTAGIIPDHCLYSELLKELKRHQTDEIEEKLKELQLAGRIERGRTINDIWIKTK